MALPGGQALPMLLTQIGLEEAAIPCNETRAGHHPPPPWFYRLASKPGLQTWPFSQAFWELTPETSVRGRCEGGSLL